MITKCIPAGDLFPYLMGRKGKSGKLRESKVLRGNPRQARDFLLSQSPRFARPRRPYNRHWVPFCRDHLTHLISCFSEPAAVVKPCLPPVMKATELLLLAGLPRDVLQFVWVQHEDRQEDEAHAHAGMVRTLLSFHGPYVPKLSAPLCLHFDRLVSRRLGLSDPLDPERASLVHAAEPSWKPENEALILKVCLRMQEAWKQEQVKPPQWHQRFLRVLGDLGCTVLSRPAEDGLPQREPAADETPEVRVPMYPCTVSVRTPANKVLCFVGPVCRPWFNGTDWQGHLEWRKQEVRTLRDRPESVFNEFARLFLERAREQQDRHPGIASDCRRASLEDFDWINPRHYCRRHLPLATEPDASPSADHPALELIRSGPYTPYYGDLDLENPDVTDPHFLMPGSFDLEDVELDDLELEDPEFAEELWPPAEPTPATGELRQATPTTAAPATVPIPTTPAAAAPSAVSISEDAMGGTESAVATVEGNSSEPTASASGGSELQGLQSPPEAPVSQIGQPGGREASAHDEALGKGTSQQTVAATENKQETPEPVSATPGSDSSEPSETSSPEAQESPRDTRPPDHETVASPGPQPASPSPSPMAPGPATAKAEADTPAASVPIPAAPPNNAALDEERRRRHRHAVWQQIEQRIADHGTGEASEPWVAVPPAPDAKPLASDAVDTPRVPTSSSQKTAAASAGEAQATCQSALTPETSARTPETPAAPVAAATGPSLEDEERRRRHRHAVWQQIEQRLLEQAASEAIQASPALSRAPDAPPPVDDAAAVSPASIAKSSRTDKPGAEGRAESPPPEDGAEAVEVQGDATTVPIQVSCVNPSITTSATTATPETAARIPETPAAPVAAATGPALEDEERRRRHREALDRQIAQRLAEHGAGKANVPPAAVPLKAEVKPLASDAVDTPRVPTSASQRTAAVLAGKAQSTWQSALTPQTSARSSDAPASPAAAATDPPPKDEERRRSRKEASDCQPPRCVRTSRDPETALASKSPGAHDSRTPLPPDPRPSLPPLSAKEADARRALVLQIAVQMAQSLELPKPWPAQAWPGLPERRSSPTLADSPSDQNNSFDLS